MRSRISLRSIRATFTVSTYGVKSVAFFDYHSCVSIHPIKRGSPLTGGMSGRVQAPERRGFELQGAFRQPGATLSWMLTGFVVALASTAVMFAAFGAGSRGTALGLEVTARWSFLLFWPAYAGSAAATLFGGPRFAGWARRGREFGLAFASAQLVHVGLVLWYYHIASERVGLMLFFWAGVLCTCALALFSLPRLRTALGPRLWRIFRTVALEYIALVFAADFIRLPLREGYENYPPSYLPFAVVLVASAGLRLAAFARRMMAARRLGPRV
jgi:hypothetical protein